MVFVIGLSVRLVKKGYKTYKKHQAEKELREKGTLTAIEDPSYELPDAGTNVSRRVELPSNEPFTHHRNSSSSSVSSDSSTTPREAELALENDEEFRQFMERQKQMYMSQHRVARDNGSTNSSHPRSMVSELPSSTVDPPAYSVVMEEDAWKSRSVGQSAESQTTQRAELESTDTAALVSPISPNTRSRVSEIDGTEISPVSPQRRSKYGASELPATPTVSQ